MSQLKKQRLLDKKLYSILKEIFVFVAFLFFMFWVAFSNQSKCSFQYKQLFVNTFVESQNLQEKDLADVGIYSTKFFLPLLISHLEKRNYFLRPYFFIQ